MGLVLLLGLVRGLLVLLLLVGALVVAGGLGLLEVARLREAYGSRSGKPPRRGCCQP